MQYYEKNIKLLKKNFKGIYNKIKAAENDNLFEINQDINDEIVAKIIDKKNNFAICIEKDRKDGYTMKVKNDEKEIYFHSKYDPKREAKKIVKNFGFSSKKQIFVLGTGLGYYLNQFDNEKKYDKIIIIEPFLSIFYAALCYNDLSNFLSNTNLALIIENNNEIFDTARRFMKLNLKNEIDFLEHSPSIKLFNEIYEIIYSKIKETIDYQKVGLVSDIKQTKKWRDNIINNANYIVNNPKIDSFFNEFEKIPAICVSAGPSLDININILRKAKNKAIILCVGTALQVLLKHNIEPDIVVSMDGNIANYRQFENMDVPNSYLLSELGNHYMINEKWNNKQIFFSMKRNFSGWIEKIKGEYTPIQTGGTVAHSMIDSAYKFGANPIVLVGQDLAFKDNKTHATGIIGGGYNMKKLIEVEGVDGSKVYTDKSLKTMLSFFNNYFNKRNDRIFIDATEGGAKIDNTRIMKLNDVITQYCIDEINIREKLDNFYLKLKKDIKLENEFKKQIENTIFELEESIKITKKQINVMEDVKTELIKNKEFTDKEIDKLEYSFSKYETDLKDTQYVSYFVEKILIPESMKLDKVKSKYYISKQKSLEERLDAYYNFRKKFLLELEHSLSLLEELYLEDNDKIILKRNYFKRK